MSTKKWTPEEMRDEVFTTINDIFGVTEGVTPNTKFEELSVNPTPGAFDLLLFEIEIVFNISFEEEEVEQFSIVQNLLDSIKGKANIV